jgi:hypothetical protein
MQVTGLVGFDWSTRPPLAAGEGEDSDWDDESPLETSAATRRFVQTDSEDDTALPLPMPTDEAAQLSRVIALHSLDESDSSVALFSTAFAANRFLAA